MKRAIGPAAVALLVSLWVVAAADAAANDFCC